MTKERYQALMRDEALRLTPEEVAEGWFFCCEWDGLLIQRGDPESECCTCAPHVIDTFVEKPH